jgi:hypothetical protein
LHHSLAPFRFFFIGFVSANSEKTEIETWNREASMHGKPIHDGADRDETFEKLLLTYSYELFDPSKDLLPKS